MDTKTCNPAKQTRQQKYYSTISEYAAIPLFVLVAIFGALVYVGHKGIQGISWALAQIETLGIRGRL